MKPLGLVDELYRKALDQIASLQSQFEHDRISAESYRVGIETVWACLGGVLDTEDFQALMHDANEEVNSLPPEPRVRVFRSNGRQLVILRGGGKVTTIRSQNPVIGMKLFPVEDDAVDFVSMVTNKAISGGFGVVG
jgi:hypothetical protein